MRKGDDSHVAWQHRGGSEGRRKGEEEGGGHRGRLLGRRRHPWVWRKRRRGGEVEVEGCGCAERQ